jgi:4-amino-4-deoxy-L-arabinose transferase-like glycosyltransferase
VAQNAHNDIVMIFFLLAAVWALVRQHSERNAVESKNAAGAAPLEGSASFNSAHALSAKRGRAWRDAIYPLLVCLFLALSILTKFITIVVVPFFLLALWPRPALADRSRG